MKQPWKVVCISLRSAGFDSILKGKTEHYDYRKGLRTAKKIQKLKPDTVLKNYWRSNERFADFMEKIAGTGRLPFMRCWIFRKK